jgi:hypothetical protein
MTRIPNLPGAAALIVLIGVATRCGGSPIAPELIAPALPPTPTLHPARAVLVIEDASVISRPTLQGLVASRPQFDSSSERRGHQQRDDPDDLSGRRAAGRGYLRLH